MELFKRKYLFIILLLFLSIICGILLILTIVYSVLYSIEKNKVYINQTNDLCLTEYCIKIGLFFIIDS